MLEGISVLQRSMMACPRTFRTCAVMNSQYLNENLENTDIIRS